MRILSTIIEIAALSMLDMRQQAVLRHTITSKRQSRNPAAMSLEIGIAQRI
jgi:hypothetical protein